METLDVEKGKNGLYSEMWLTIEDLYDGLKDSLGMALCTFKHRLYAARMTGMVSYRSKVMANGWGKCHTKTVHRCDSALFLLLFGGARRHATGDEAASMKRWTKDMGEMGVQDGLGGAYSGCWMTLNEIADMCGRKAGGMVTLLNAFSLKCPEDVAVTHGRGRCALYRAGAELFRMVFSDHAAVNSLHRPNAFLDMTKEEYDEYRAGTPVGRKYNELSGKVNSLIRWTDQHDGRIRTGTLVSILPYTFRAVDGDGEHWETIKLASPELIA